jgi:hypothetical protein
MRLTSNGEAEGPHRSGRLKLRAHTFLDTTESHGPLQLFLDGSGTDISFAYSGSAGSFPSLRPA